MRHLLEVLSGALGGTPLLALAGAAGWGVASILLSPCHLASIPLIIGYIGGGGPTSGRRAAATAGAFALGILITVALVGAAAALLGHTLGTLGSAVNYAVAAVFLAVGLDLIGVIQLRWWSPSAGNLRGKGLLGGLLLGLVFGLALGPCTFAFLAPVLGTALAVGAARPLLAGALTLAFGLGHCAVIVAAGSSTGLVTRLLRWDESSGRLEVLRKACGILVLAGGVYLVYAA